jgi:two-component system, NtrC family, C4-dicarboxylate transport sensor histidine kinase DctB
MASWIVRLAVGSCWLGWRSGWCWVTNLLLTERFTETTRNRAEVRLALYTGNMISELQRNSVVPLLLARDPALDRGAGQGGLCRHLAS